MRPSTHYHPPAHHLKGRTAPKETQSLVRRKIAGYASARSHRRGPRTPLTVHRTLQGATNSAGSSLKFCMLAAGEADLYPRFGPTCSGTPPPGTQCCARRASPYAGRRTAPLRARCWRRRGVLSQPAFHRVGCTGLACRASPRKRNRAPGRLRSRHNPDRPDPRANPRPVGAIPRLSCRCGRLRSA